tara:strand:- start:1043 stop:1555 length:513 start_codon:yes stop_codon:yes gene_type:complete
MVDKLDDILNHGEFKKKKRVNSRRKGNAFERDIAKLLNTRFNTTDFCRSPGSGAFATTHDLPQYMKVHGDLITPQYFKFILECKSGYDVTFEDIFKPKSDLYKFIEQASRDAKRADREWLVVYKKTRHKPFVIVGKKYNLTHNVSINDKYYIYSLTDFLSLDDSNFLPPE